MSQSYELKIGADTLEELAKLKKPIIAIEELIWNSVDADATQVDVQLHYGKLGALESVTVSDNGLGLRHEDCELAFGKLGDSPKKRIQRTPGGRMPHGKLGRGRFRAFGIGREVTWTSCYEENGNVLEFDINCFKATISKFAVGDPEKQRRAKPGMVVSISGIEESLPALENTESAVSELTKRFALYLLKYKSISIKYDGKIVNPRPLIHDQRRYELSLTLPDETAATADLLVVEWEEFSGFERALYLCDANGFARDEQLPQIHAKSYRFTAYLSCELVSELDDQNAFALASMHPSVHELLRAAREKLREHFRKKDASRAASLRKEWKRQRIYPYDRDARDPLERAEQDVFDLCAMQVNDYLPSFEVLEQQAKRLTFRLLKHTLETSPTHLQQIMGEVLTLTQDKQNELVELLKQTRLSAIINAANVVAQRIDVIEALQPLLFGELKESMTEMPHLQRLMEDSFWIFGEDYSLSVSDQYLDAALEEHIQLLGRKRLIEDAEPVLDVSEGRRRRLDMLLSRRCPRGHSRFEHLVIELKRPSLVLGTKELTQIENYAFTVSSDPRFDKQDVKWTFILIGNELDAFVTERSNQQHRDFGHIHSAANLDIHVRKWASVINEVRWRYQFFQDRLNYQVSSEEALEKLRGKYFLPDE